MFGQHLFSSDQGKRYHVSPQGKLHLKQDPNHLNPAMPYTTLLYLDGPITPIFSLPEVYIIVRVMDGSWKPLACPQRT